MKAEKNEHLADWPVEVVRSARRQKSVSAELKNGVLVVRAPRRHQLLRDLTPFLARSGQEMYERQGAWLETQGLENRGMVLSGVRSPPAEP